MTCMNSIDILKSLQILGMYQMLLPKHIWAHERTISSLKTFLVQYFSQPPDRDIISFNPNDKRWKDKAYVVPVFHKTPAIVYYTSTESWEY